MGVKIVVAEDDRSTLAFLEKTLILRGFWVYGTRDGEEAFEVIKKEIPDLVISDMLMPRLHGLDLCMKIKESPELSHIKVILITGVRSAGVPLSVISLAAIVVLAIMAMLGIYDGRRFNEMTMRKDTHG